MEERYRISLGEPRLSWTRVLVPSAADCVFLAILGTLLLTPLSMKLLGDAGIGWHIRAGQWMWTNHAIPRVDMLSASAQGQPWFAWEWLYDLVVGRLDSVAGLNGVVWFNAMVIAGVFSWLFRLLLARGTNFIWALVLMLLAMSAAAIHLLARPHVVSWMFVLGWWWILSSVEGDGKSPPNEHRPSTSLRAGYAWGTRELWLLPVSMLVWVNVHGGFLIGFVLLGIFWLAAAWEWGTTREDRIEDTVKRIVARKRWRALTYVGIASAAATLVNPYGWKLHEHIYSYLTNGFLMDHIEEFQSPNFHGIAGKCFAILGLITIVAMARKNPHPTNTALGGAPSASEKLPTQRTPRRVGQPTVSEILIVLFAVWAGLYAARNVPVSAILLAMVIGPRLPGLGAGFSARMSAMQAELRGHVWPLVGVVLTLWIATNGGRVGSSHVMDARFDPARMPVGAVNYIEQSGLEGPIFSPDYWGGYLIYRFYPDRRAVIDDRHDLYGERALKYYLKMWRVEEGWKEPFASQHFFGILVLPKDAALTNALLLVPGWRVVYRDDTAVVFENQMRANQ